MNTLKKLKIYLKKTPTKGDKFTEAMLDTLQREYNWLNWKRENCPPFEKSSTKKPLTTETLATKRKRDIPAVGEKKEKKTTVRKSRTF